MIVLGIDPGAKHCGYCWYKPVPRSDHFSSERGAGTLPPDELLEFVDAKLEEFVREVGEAEVKLVVEEFRLYASHAMAQAWDTMMTSEVIGALKWIARQHSVEVIEQGATIKKPTKAQLKPRGIKPFAQGAHARDAELHTLHYVLKEGLWV
jgi:hypothetical protein